MKKIVIFISIFFPLFFISPARATTIFSPLVEMEVSPGQKQSGVVKVYNETSDNLYLTASVESFKAKDESGQPLYLSLEEKDSFLNWFSLSQKAIVLKPAQVILVPFTVSVPKEATPGGYYAVIFWQTSPPEAGEGAAVGIAGKVGTLVLLKVKGEILEQGEILEFTPQPPKNYFFKLPINFLIRFKNIGNIHLKPVGEIKLKNWFGQIQTLPVNNPPRNVLPASVRRFEVIWGQNLTGDWFQQFLPILQQELKYFTLGPYRAILTLNYGSEQEQTVSKEISFWFIPYHLIITVLLAIFVLIILRKINKKINQLKRRDKTPA